MDRLESKAVLIEERIAARAALGAHAAGKERELAEKRAADWRALLSGGHGAPIFERRLLAEGLSEADALAIAGEPPESAQGQAAELLAPALEALRRYTGAAFTALGREGLEAEAGMRIAAVQKPGPLYALLPFVCEGRRRLAAAGVFREDGPLTAAAAEQLSLMLFQRLYLICAQAFNARIHMLLKLGLLEEHKKDPRRKLEEDLLSGQWESFFALYPMLARQVGTAMLHFVAFAQEFYERFQRDLGAVADVFFEGEEIREILRIEGEVSDLHKNGRCVLLLRLKTAGKTGAEQERRLVYKPRSLRIDAAWKQFTDGLPPRFGIKAPRCLDLGDYGFIEYVENIPCKDRLELEAYFKNAGALMALIYAFGGNDFHMENIIACGSSPVIIDTETLMIPAVRPFAQNGVQAAAAEEKPKSIEATLEDSVMKQGFLPAWRVSPENKREDLGALTGSREDLKNLPLLEGERYTAKGFRREVAAGFTAMYDYLMENRLALGGKDGLSMFDGCLFRMLIRTSQTYGNLLERLLHPANLLDGFTFSLKAERLVNAFLYEAPEAILPSLIRVFLSEKRAVCRGDVPIFYAQPDGEGILDEEGLLFESYFSATPLQRARQRILELNEEDCRIQLQIIEQSLALESRDMHAYKEEQDDGADSEEEKALLTDASLLEEAEAIFDRIMAARFVVYDEYSWLSEQYDPNRGGSCLSLMGPALYDGLLGLGVFMSGLYTLTGKAAHKEAALHCLRRATVFLDSLSDPFLQALLSPGYSAGVGGFLAGLVRIEENLGEPAAGAAAERLVDMLSPALLKKDVHYDVFSGVSGLVLGLHTWLDRSGKAKGGVLAPGMEAFLQSCGAHLLAARKHSLGEFLLWPSQDASQPLTGMGHGAAGLGLACLSLYDLLGDTAYLEAALSAAGYEDSVFDESSGNWPDYRVDPKEPADAGQKRFMSGYCSGAPGIGLARLAALDLLDKRKGEPGAAALRQLCERDVERALKFVCRVKREGRNHLCCGGAGQLDFLLEAARRQDGARREELELLARRKISRLVAGKRQRGYYNLHPVAGEYYYNPTLFQGEAGIGLEILRTVAPDKIASVLI